MSAAHSTSEVGIEANIANFARLIATATALSDKYKPAKDTLQLDALKAKSAEVKAAVKATADLRKPFLAATGVRKTAFAPLKKLSTRILGAIRLTSGVDPATLADAEATNRKIQGGSKSKKEPDNPEEPILPGEDKTISTSQQSFINLAARLGEQVSLLSNLDRYAPNEAELQTGSLQDLYKTLGDHNQAVTDAYAPYNLKRIARNKLFNDPVTGLVDTATDFKTYIKSAFGATAPEYKSISKLKFVEVKD